MVDIGTLMATISTDLAPLRAGLVDAEKAMNDASVKMSNSLNKVTQSTVEVGRAMAATGKAMSKSLTLPILGAASASFKFYKDFEHYLSRIEGLVGIAREQVYAWGQELITMGPKLAKSPKDLADALYFITSAGMRGADAMEVLEMSAKGASAGLGDIKVIADLVTSAVNAFGKANLTAQQAVEGIIATVREGKAEAPLLTDSLGVLFPIAAEMGVSFQQVGAAVAGMTRTGTEAHMAVTQLRQIMVSLLKPTQQAERALFEMGTSSELLRKKLREDGLLATLMEIQKRTEGVGEEQISSVFGNIRALAGVLDLLGENLEGNKLIFASLADNAGDLDKALSAARHTIEYKWKKAIAGSQSIMILFGQSLRSAFLPLLDKLNHIILGLVERMQGWSDVTKRTLTVILTITAALGPLLVALGFLFTNVIPGLVTVFGGLRLMLIVVNGYLVKFGAILAANPYAAAAMGILLIVNSLMKMRRQVSGVEAATNEISKRTQAIVSDETASVQKLIGVLRSETATRTQQADALRELNAISPEYFQNLELQGTAAAEATLSLEKYMGTMAQQDVTVRRALNTLADYTASVFDQENALAALQGINSDLFAGFEVGWVTIEKARNALIEYTKNAKKQREEISRLVDVVRNEASSKEAVISAMSKLSELAPTLAADLMKERGIVNGLTDAYNAWTDAIQKKARAQASEEYLVELYRKEIELSEKVRVSQERMEANKLPSAARSSSSNPSISEYETQEYRTSDVRAFNKANQQLITVRQQIKYVTEETIIAQRNLTQASVEEESQLRRLTSELEVLKTFREELFRIIQEDVSTGYSTPENSQELLDLDTKIAKLEQEKFAIEEVIEARKRLNDTTSTDTDIIKGIIETTEEEIRILTDELRSAVTEDEVKRIAALIGEKEKYLESLTGAASATNKEAQALNKLNTELKIWQKILAESDTTVRQAAAIRRINEIEEEIEKMKELATIMASYKPVPVNIPEEFTRGLLPKQTHLVDADTELILMKFRDGLAEAEAMAAIFGDSFDLAAAKVELAKEALEEMHLKGIVPASKGMQEMVETLEELTIDEIFDKYRSALEEIHLKQSLFGVSVESLQSIVSLLQNTMTALVAGGLDPASDAFLQLEDAVAQVEAQIKSLEGEMTNLKEISKMVANSIAQGFMNAAAYGKKSTSQIIKQILAQVTAQLIQQMIASLPPGVNIIAAAGAGAIAGALFNQIPEFAKGGLAYGPSLGVFGEYPGASTNPEVIAPLNKLQKMLNVSIQTSLQALVQQQTNLQDIAIDATVTVPSIEMPRVDIPDISILTARLDVPKIQAMDVKTPDIALSELVLSVPDITIPDITVPELIAKVPELIAQVPELVTTIPTFTPPSITVPELIAQVPDLVAKIPELVIKVPETILSDAQTFQSSITESILKIKESIISGFSSVTTTTSIENKAFSAPDSLGTITTIPTSSIKDERLNSIRRIIDTAVYTSTAKEQKKDVFTEVLERSTISIPEIKLPDISTDVSVPNITVPELIARVPIIETLNQAIPAPKLPSLTADMQVPKVPLQMPAMAAKMPDLSIPTIQIQEKVVKEVLAPVEALKWPNLSIPDLLLPEIIIPKTPQLNNPQIPRNAFSMLSEEADLSARMSTAMMEIRLKEQDALEVRGNLKGNDIYLSNERTSKNRLIID